MGQGLVQTRDLLQHAMQEENEELLESIAYILADYAYYYLGELVTDEAIGKVVFALILDAADHSGDYKIIEMTFRIWENLTDFLKQQQSATTGYMQEILASLVRILLKKLQYPSEGSSSLSSWTSQKRDDFRAFRHCIGDSLKDCCDLLSIDLVLSILVPSLGATSDISLHVELESKLTALRLVSSCIQDAVAYSSLSRLFVELPHLWSMTKHPNVGKDPEITSLLQYAIILIISSYSPWIDLHVRNPTELLQLFTLLKEALESSVDSSSVNDSRQLQSVFGASCLALRHFCQCCSPRLLSIYPESGQIVHHFYTIHETTLTIDTDCLFKSLVFLILAANGSSSDEMVLKLATDLVQHKIAPLLKVTHAGNASTSALTIAYLERYKILIEESKVQGKFNGNYSDEAVASSNHPLLDNFRIFLQVLLFDYHHTMQSSLDGPLEESICKVIRVALHSISSESFLLKRSNEETLFSTLIDFMQIAFNKSTNPTAILYLTQTLIRQFSHLNPPYTTTILAFVTQIHGDLLTMTPGRVTWTVQLLEDYFHLIAVMMEYLPEAVLCQQSYNSSSSTTASTSILIYPPQSILQLVMSFLDTLQDCEFDPAQLHIMFTVTLDLLHVLFEETSYPINPSHLNPSLMPVMMKSLWRLAIQVFPAASPLIKDVSSIISLIIRVDTALSLHILKMECVQLLPDHLFSPYEKNRLQNEIEVLLLLGGQPGDENSNRKNLILFLRQVARTFQRRII